MISIKHKEFIRLIASGETQANAYRLSIGKEGISKSACEAKGSLLVKKYAKEIQQLIEKKAKAIESAYEKNDVQIALKSILTQAEVDAKLCDIILKAKHDGDRLRAIEVYNKRFGSNAPIRSDMNVTQIPAPIIELSK
jgi:hypothetical protein